MKKEFSPKLALLFALVGVIFMAVGYFDGEIQVFFEKSVRLCLECVGIG
ncbi:MAG: CD1871A family CXXC motif-containing protein [Acutalibacteraceae bacterium]